jgi:hypothetical protein
MSVVAATSQQWYIWTVPWVVGDDDDPPFGLVALHYDTDDVSGAFVANSNFTTPQFWVTNRSEEVVMWGGGNVESSTVSTSSTRSAATSLQALASRFTTPTSTPTEVVEGSFDRSSGHEGLSRKNAAGVTVGVVAGSILLFVGVYVFLYRQRKRKRTRHAKSGPKMDERIERDVNDYRAILSNVQLESEGKPLGSGIVESSAEKKLPRVEDLDELVVELRT